MNRFPDVKKFVLESGGADQYDGVEVKFLPDHNPDLVIFDATGGEPKRIDMTEFHAPGALHELMAREGFQRKSRESKDADVDCKMWARRGECVRNPTFMLATCATSCAETIVEDEHANCPEWAKLGHCETNPRYMVYHCSRSCISKHDEL